MNNTTDTILPQVAPLALAPCSAVSLAYQEILALAVDRFTRANGRTRERAEGLLDAAKMLRERIPSLSPEPNLVRADAAWPLDYNFSHAEWELVMKQRLLLLFPKGMLPIPDAR